VPVNDEDRHPNLLRLRIDTLLRRMANRARIGVRVGIRAAVEGGPPSARKSRERTWQSVGCHRAAKIATVIAETGVGCTAGELARF